jgi:hypothetical protein
MYGAGEGGSSAQDTSPGAMNRAATPLFRSVILTLTGDHVLDKSALYVVAPTYLAPMDQDYKAQVLAPPFMEQGVISKVARRWIL